jgi:hypothetical protein
MCILGYFVTNEAVLMAIRDNNPKLLAGIKCWSDEFVLHLIVNRMADGTLTANSPLEMAAVSCPQVFDAIWGKLSHAKLINADLLFVLQAFIKQGDFLRFECVWALIKANALSLPERLALLKAARGPVSSNIRKCKMDLDDNYDTNDAMLRISWYRLNRGIELHEWIGNAADKEYLEHLLCTA